MLDDGALEDAKGARVAGVRGGGADVEAAAALGAEPVEGALPGDVGEEVGGFRARGEDQVFVVGALGYEGADFFLEGGRGLGVVSLEVGWELVMGTDLGEDFLFFEAAQLGGGALEVEARLVGDAGHCCRLGGFGVCNGQLVVGGEVLLLGGEVDEAGGGTGLDWTF